MVAAVGISMVRETSLRPVRVARRQLPEKARRVCPFSRGPIRVEMGMMEAVGTNKIVLRMVKYV